MYNNVKHNLEPHINVCREDFVVMTVLIPEGQLMIWEMHQSVADHSFLVFSVCTTLVRPACLVLNGSFLFTELPYDPTQDLSLHSD